MRPFKRTYRWDESTQSWRDVRLMARESVHAFTVDPLTKGRWFRNFRREPLWISSRSELKAACEKYGTVLTG